MSGNKELGKLSVEAFKRNESDPDLSTLAVLARQSDLRHLMQQSAVTIHGCSTPINKTSEAEELFARIRIPATSKETFRQAFSVYSISRETLFPDLESLAKSLASTDFSVLS